MDTGEAYWKPFYDGTKDFDDDKGSSDEYR